MNTRSLERKGKPDNEKVDFYSADSFPYGISFGSWTVRWWNWIYSIPKNRNPSFDDTGKFAAEGQSGPVWFLAGTWVHQHTNYPHRMCSVSSDVSLLFPLINCEENPLEFPEYKAEDELKTQDTMRRVLSKDMATVRGLKCRIDDDDGLPAQLVRSDPEFFSVILPNDIPIHHVGGSTVMTTSGYWIFLKPLSKGSHYISFEGSYQYGKLHSGATYDIMVV